VEERRFSAAYMLHNQSGLYKFSEFVFGWRSGLPLRKIFVFDWGFSRWGTCRSLFLQTVKPRPPSQIIP
jgi:hypothetical protein